MKTFEEFLNGVTITKPEEPQEYALEEAVFPKPVKAASQEDYHLYPVFSAIGAAVQSTSDHVNQAKSDLKKFIRTLDKEDKKPFNQILKKLETMGSKMFDEGFYGVGAIVREFKEANQARLAKNKK
ncbi:hypothetical protein [Providencia phage PSTRCR_127]|nr:hypothetical protein [Providencia phage PSTRCR_127]UGO50174.1 hypothetical protein RGZ1_157 [Morganella phage vB_MmoM_Rgz1]